MGVVAQIWELIAEVIIININTTKLPPAGRSHACAGISKYLNI